MPRCMPEGVFALENREGYFAVRFQYKTLLYEINFQKKKKNTFSNDSGFQDICKKLNSS